LFDRLRLGGLFLVFLRWKFAGRQVYTGGSVEAHADYLAGWLVFGRQLVLQA
jgi:hypothetical protein